jgi:protein ImuB
MGLTTLSDLRALPRSGLARRFGEGLLEDLDRALGRAPDPRRWLEPPERFESRLELHHRADSAEQVLAGAAVLLVRLVAWADARHGRIGAFTLVMRHEPKHRSADVPATELRIELAEPDLEAEHLHLLLRERLARCTLAAPTLELRLRCSHLVPGPAPNRELFPTPASESLGLARLLERLRARLGDAQVQRLHPVADHRPERASIARPALAAEPPRANPSATAPAHAPTFEPAFASTARRSEMRAGPDPVAAAEALLPIARPSWLLTEPLPLASEGELPRLDGQTLQLLAGPERIEAGWWDGSPVARDYYIAMTAEGSLVWVWRSRLPLDSAAVSRREAQWFLQGRFA